jgi:hypothetical protein
MIFRLISWSLVTKVAIGRTKELKASPKVMCCRQGKKTIPIQIDMMDANIVKCTA